jgi:hypothetical protein
MYSEHSKLGKWVDTQRRQYRLLQEGKRSQMTNPRIQAFGSLGFEWEPPHWEDRLSELADYRKIHGHCNVPQKYSENSKLAHWVKTQRCQYSLLHEGNTSSMTTFRIQELESLGFEWGIVYGATWEDHLSELTDYRKIHGPWLWHVRVAGQQTKTSS